MMSQVNRASDSEKRQVQESAAAEEDVPQVSVAPHEGTPQKPQKADAASSRGVSRRTFTLGAVGACAVLGLGGVKFLPSKTLLRPPGGQDEEALIQGCLHCEKCREVCPRGAIAPAHLEDGILNARTPRMDFKRGWCDFCENEPGGPKCVAACPTHALVCPDPANVIIGKAVLNVDWCLASKGMGCHECVDVCNYEALELGADNVPVVNTDACNGCGACELACISLTAGSITTGATDRAIVVVPVEEMGV